MIMVTSQQSHLELAVMKKLRSSQGGALSMTLSLLVTTPPFVPVVMTAPLRLSRSLD